jgi:hypothetical protein
MLNAIDKRFLPTKVQTKFHFLKRHTSACSSLCQQQYRTDVVKLPPKDTRIGIFTGFKNFNIGLHVTLLSFFVIAIPSAPLLRHNQRMPFAITTSLSSNQVNSYLNQPMQRSSSSKSDSARSILHSVISTGATKAIHEHALLR